MDQRSPHPSPANPTSPTVDRHEIERIRRSVAMLPPGQKSLTREDAMALLRRLDRSEAQLDQLRLAVSDLLGR